MKALQKLIYISALGLIISSCKKEEVEVVSLTKAGDEFYFGERVLVYAPTNGDKDEISYNWDATGGYFLGQRVQNLFENIWVAPAQVGDYEMTVSARNGKTTSSKKSMMKVTRYFFDRFQSSRFTISPNGSSLSNGWTQNNTSQAFTNSNDTTLSRIELTSSSTSGPRIQRLLNLAPLRMPFSIQTKLGYTAFPRTDQAYTISLFFTQPLKNLDNPYIREIRWEVWPTRPGTADTYRLRFETFVPRTASSKFTPTNVAPTTLDPSPGFLVNPANGRNTIFLSNANQIKTLTFSIDKDYVFTAKVDGVLFTTSNAIKDWLTFARANYSNFEEPLAREYRIAFPARQTSTSAATTMFVRSVYINNDGTNLN
jgi:hypothetical protein